MAQLQLDPAHLAYEKEIEAQQRENKVRYRLAARELLGALNAAGFSVESVGELRHKCLNYSRAIALLLDWLPRISDPDVKEDIVRTLSVPWARPVAALSLIAEFRRQDAPGSLKWAIGNALDVVADASVVTELVQIAREKQHGTARQMVVHALGKFRANAVVLDALVECLSDKDVVLHSVIALGKIGDPTAIPHLEAIVSEAKGPLKKYAERGLGACRRRQ